MPQGARSGSEDHPPLHKPAGGPRARGPLADEAELRAARDDRDSGFEALVAGAEAADFARRHAAANDLTQAVRNSMRACDELGDSIAAKRPAARRPRSAAPTSQSPG